MTLRRVPLSGVLLALSAFAQGDADALHKAAEQALNRGDYATAIDRGTAELSLAVTRADKKREGEAENLLGAAHLHQGNYAPALPHFLRAVALARETGDARAEIRRLNNVGNVYFYLGQYAQAYESYQSAQQRLQAQTAQPWHAGTQQLTLTNLAVLHQQLGQHQKALDLYKEIRALPLRLKPSIEAQVLTNLAIVYRRLGDPQKALDTYEQARKLLAGDPNAAASLYALHNVGVVQALDFRDLPAALRTFTEAIGLATRSGSRRELVLERLFRGETLLLLRREREARADFDAALADARALKLTDELWTALYGLGRLQAAAGDRAAALASFREAVGVIESERSKLGNTSLKAEFLAGKRDVYDALIGLLLDEPQPPVAEILRRIEDGRARNLKDLLPAEKQTVTLEQARGALDGETAALVYWSAGGRLATVWLTRAGAGVTQRTLTKEDEGQLAALAAALKRKESADWEPLAAQVSRLLLDDRLPLAGVRRLVVVPDGALHTLPFEVLPLASGARVVEQFAVSYLPSAHFLAARTRSAARLWPWERSATVFADPVASSPSGPFDGGFARLPYAAEEARTIAAALPGRVRLFVGPENRKRELFADPGPVLHFATHGEVDVNDSRRSRLVFTPEAGDAGSQYLFANEVGRLSLQGVDLVTLAACESERGRFVRGEGVENFGRAFLGAGAGATVSSLWRVSDRASAELMRLFYEELARGATKADALRAAKLAMLRDGGRPHPYYWAAYLLSGDAYTPVAAVIPWWQPGLAAAIVIAAAAICFFKKICSNRRLPRS